MILIPDQLVGVEGFEPSVSCSQSRRIRPDFPTLRKIKLFDVLHSLDHGLLREMIVLELSHRVTQQAGN